MASRETGFGVCRGPARSLCQPPVLPRSRSLLGQPQRLANPELASAAKRSHLTMDRDMMGLFQEMGHICHPLTPFVPAKGRSTIPRNKRREKGWMP